MNLKIVTGNKIFKSIPLIVLVSLFISLFNISELTKYNIPNLNSSHLIVFSYGYLDPSSIKQLIPVIIWISPQLLLIYLLGGSIYNNLQNKIIYTFTRTNKRIKWFFNQSNYLFINVFLFYLINFLITILVGSLNNIEIITKNVLIILIVLLIQVFGSYLLLLFINMLSLYFKISYSYVAVLSLTLFLIMFSGLIFEFSRSHIKFIKWLPTSQSFISWHNLYLVHDFQNLIHIDYLEGFKLNFTFSYYFIFYLIIMSFSMRKINKMDII